MKIFAASLFAAAALAQAKAPALASGPWHSVEVRRTVAYLQDSLVMKDLWPGTGYYIADSAFQADSSSITWHLRGNYNGGDYSRSFFDTSSACVWMAPSRYAAMPPDPSLYLYNTKLAHAHDSSYLLVAHAPSHDSLVFAYTAAQDTAVFSLYWIDVNNDAETYLPGNWSWNEIRRIAGEMRLFYNQQHQSDIKRADITRFEFRLLPGKALSVSPAGLPRLRKAGPAIDALGRPATSRHAPSVRLLTPPIP
jgi:hypothetical protein